MKSINKCKETDTLTHMFLMYNFHVKVVMRLCMKKGLGFGLRVYVRHWQGVDRCRRHLYVHRDIHVCK